MIKRTTIVEVVANRDAALLKAREAADLLAQGYGVAREAANLQRAASAGHSFYFDQHRQQAAYGALFADLDVSGSVEAFRRHLDASTWVHLLELAGISRLMDRTATERFHADLTKDPPPVSVESVYQILSDLVGDRELIFGRSVARIFSELDRRFRSHDGFKIGSRMILTNIFDAYGSWSYHNHAREQVIDCERIFQVLDGAQGDPGQLVRDLDAARKGFGPRQAELESTYFRIRTYKNGNAHLWFTRDDLVEKVNRVLADYYGEVLADGVPRETTVQDYTTTALSKDLAFYPTPEPVVKAILDMVSLHPGASVLEPSAGMGALVRGALRSGASVHAVEVDRTRFLSLRALAATSSRMTVQQANFLQMPPDPRFSHVLMNPPFAGTHWIDHVVHAYDFLAPGGMLVAVVPASVETGATGKHETFLKWAKARRERHYRMIRDLPAESFAESGTRIQTCLLVLGKVATRG